MPISAYAAQDSTKMAARTNFGLTKKQADDSVEYVYLNDKGAYKYGGANKYPHFIGTDSGIYHIHGQVDMNSKLPDLRNKNQYPYNIEIKAGGTVKLLFDGTFDGEEGLVWDFSALGRDGDVSGLTNQYSMVKVKDGSSDRPTNLEIHFAGKCTIAAPRLNSVINSYGSNCNVTVILHDDCDVTLKGGAAAAAIGGSGFEEGRNITIKTDGKYNGDGVRISYKANGKLTCYGGDQASAIGSSCWADAGNITIESGIIYAYGGDRGAAIGSGTTKPISGHTNISRVNGITIKGGTVYAFGGDYAAGIGSGEYGTAENINITGGTVEATGGKGAAAIGGGAEGSASNIAFTGGKVTANLTGSYNAYPIGRGYKTSDRQVTSNNNQISVPNDCKASLAITLRNNNTIPTSYYSCDKGSLDGWFSEIIDYYNNAVKSVEINFTKCENHDLVWFIGGHYKYCKKCQSVKAYDDTAPTLDGIDSTVHYGSWVEFDSEDALGGSERKDITHNYNVGDETRSVVFRDVPREASGIFYIKVGTYAYNASERNHSTLLSSEDLTAYSGKTYRFKGANTLAENLKFNEAETSEEKLAALKMQHITIVDNAGNITVKNLYAFLTHHVECYLDGIKQEIDYKNGKDYFDVLHGSGFELTFFKDRYAQLDYQYYYYVTVNGERIPTTEDNVYNFKNVTEDLDIVFTTKFDETAPKLTVKVNGDTYDSTETGNDKKACNELKVGASVTLKAEDIAPEEHPASGVAEESFEYLISERPMTEDELKNASGWKKYTGAFILPDSKVSIVYARVKDIAGNIAYAVSAPYLPDETVPTIAGLEQDKIYCGETKFTVSDANGISSVTAGNNLTLTPGRDGNYTLDAGLGTVTVTVTDKAGNKTSVTVTVNAGHTAGDDDNDCTTPVYCIYHPDTVVVPAKRHDFSGEWHTDETEHWRYCQNEGCTVSETHSPHRGTATCKDEATCDDCGEKFREKDPDNHADLKHFPATAATTDSEGNIEYWYCSGCDKYFASEDCTEEISKDDTVTAKLPKPQSPKTGDTSNAAAWVIVLFVSGGVCIAAEIKRRKTACR